MAAFLPASWLIRFTGQNPTLLFARRTESESAVRNLADRPRTSQSGRGMPRRLHSTTPTGFRSNGISVQQAAEWNGIDHEEARGHLLDYNRPFSPCKQHFRVLQACSCGTGIRILNKCLELPGLRALSLDPQKKRSC